MDSNKLEARYCLSGPLVCVEGPLLSGQTAGTLKKGFRDPEPKRAASRFMSRGVRALFFTLLLVRKAGCLPRQAPHI